MLIGDTGMFLLSSMDNRDEAEKTVNSTCGPHFDISDILSFGAF
jgi:hypothetical protein